MQSPDKLKRELDAFEKRRKHAASLKVREVHHDTHRGHRTKAVRDQKLPETFKRDAVEYSTLRGKRAILAMADCGNFSAFID